MTPARCDAVASRCLLTTPSIDDTPASVDTIAYDSNMWSHGYNRADEPDEATLPEAPGWRALFEDALGTPATPSSTATR